MKVYCLMYQCTDGDDVLEGIFEYKEAAEKAIELAHPLDRPHLVIEERETGRFRWCKHLRTHTDYEVGSGRTPINTYCTDCREKL